MSGDGARHASLVSLEADSAEEAAGTNDTMRTSELMTSGSVRLSLMEERGRASRCSFGEGRMPNLCACVLEALSKLEVAMAAGSDTSKHPGFNSTCAVALMRRETCVSTDEYSC